MEFGIVVLAFFFSILMCLGLILTKWIIAQLGAAVFFAILVLLVGVFLLTMEDKSHDK